MTVKFDQTNDYVTFEDANLEENGVSRDEVKQVFESDLSFATDLEPSKRGNDRMMVIDWTHGGRILEIGVEHFGNDREHVFHAMNAGRRYRRKFERRLKS